MSGNGPTGGYVDGHGWSHPGSGGTFPNEPANVAQISDASDFLATFGEFGYAIIDGAALWS